MAPSHKTRRCSHRTRARPPHTNSAAQITQTPLLKLFRRQSNTTLLLLLPNRRHLFPHKFRGFLTRLSHPTIVCSPSSWHKHVPHQISSSLRTNLTQQHPPRPSNRTSVPTRPRQKPPIRSRHHCRVRRRLHPRSVPLPLTESKCRIRHQRATTTIDADGHPTRVTGGVESE